MEIEKKVEILRRMDANHTSHAVAILNDALNGVFENFSSVPSTWSRVLREGAKEIERWDPDDPDEDEVEDERLARKELDEWQSKETGTGQGATDVPSQGAIGACHRLDRISELLELVLEALAQMSRNMDRVVDALAKGEVQR